MEIPDQTYKTIRKLEDLNYAIMNIYGDGVVLMGKTEPQGIRCFVGADGVVRPPHTTETSLAYIELVEAGLLPRKPQAALDLVHRISRITDSETIDSNLRSLISEAREIL